MSVPKSANDPSRAHWDGSRVLFDVICDGEAVSCAISLAALQDVSGRRCYKSADLLACFASARDRISAAAVVKRRARGADHVGRLNLWADDLEQADAEDDSDVAHARRAAV